MEKQFLFVDVANPTWLVYVSVLVLAVFFRFSRLFTVRNLDVLLILVLSTSLVVTSAWKNAAPPSDAAVLSQSAETAGEENPGKSSDPAPDGQDAASVLTAVVGEVPNADAESSDAGSALLSRDPSDASGSPVAAAADISAAAEKTLNAVVEPRAFHPVYQWGSVVLLTISLLLMVRLVFDEALTRRPRLEQNLNQAGLMFLCIPSFILLAISVFVFEPRGSTVAAIEHGQALLQRREFRANSVSETDHAPAPTETLIAAGAAGVAQLSGQLPVSETAQVSTSASGEALVARILVVIAHTIVVLGLLYIGKYHFSSLQLGLSMSCLYLLLPCTAFHVHELSHVLPGACLTWAIASYRKPMVAGVLLGLACGTLFFAVFLLPVWAVFYGRRGALRFGLSLVIVAMILVGCLLLTSSDTNSFMNKIVTTTNWTVYRLLDETGSAPATPFGQLFVRIPLAAVFFVMLTAMTVLPRPRNLENLLANSTALVVAAQLWYPDDIGSYVLWYLPLMLLVVFRPRLDRFTPPDPVDRHAVAVPQLTPSGAPTIVAMSRLTLYR